MLASCGTSGVTMTPEAKRQTIAQGVLNRDVLNTMSLSESAWGRGCSSPRVTGVALFSPPKQDKQSVTKATEKWTIDRCGSTVQYRVEYAENWSVTPARHLSNVGKEKESRITQDSPKNHT